MSKSFTIFLVSLMAFAPVDDSLAEVTFTQNNRAGVSCIELIPNSVVAKYDETGELCKVSKCMNGWEVSEDKASCTETDDHKNCMKDDLMEWGINGCVCKYGADANKKCRTRQEQRQADKDARQQQRNDNQTEKLKKCKEEKGEYAELKAGICTCTYGKGEDGKCLSEKLNTSKRNPGSTTGTAQGARDKEYNKDISKVIEAYNTVAKKLVSKCIADGKTIKDGECK